MLQVVRWSINVTKGDVIKHSVQGVCEGNISDDMGVG